MFTFPTDTNCSVCSYWKDWSFESFDFKNCRLQFLNLINPVSYSLSSLSRDRHFLDQ